MKKKNVRVIVVNWQSKMEWIRIEDILYLESAGNYTEICLAEGRIVTVCHSLTWCCNRLDKSIIYKACAHYAVNVFQIKEYIKASRKVKFSDKISVVIPEAKVAAFHSFIEENLVML